VLHDEVAADNGVRRWRNGGYGIERSGCDRHHKWPLAQPNSANWAYLSTYRTLRARKAESIAPEISADPALLYRLLRAL
jgi:hypothetical protein